MKRIFLMALLCCTALASAKSPLALRIVSYNLRMDTKSDSLNAWEYRKENVKALIQYHAPDIVGTQEGFLHQLKDVNQTPGYTYIGVGRDDGKEAGEHSAIFYKKDRFIIVETGNFWLRQTPNVPGKGWDATCCNRICSWAKFKEKKSKRTFYVFNVHFDHEGVIARRESGKLMVEKMKEIARDEPIICTGDFNSTPETEQIQHLASYLNDSHQTTQLPPYGPQGTFNHRFSNPITGNRIDYIFTGKKIQTLRYAHLTDNNGRNYPSDHIPVMVDLILK
ncbi:MAG: endonuclease/exonuclease/phosphatase family protein [Tannerellaceae bacterium]|jgi:endonuclease/exonuclease/phosphatase family metal-dependent hydrolase|nr:endonuclease/exonuclease/phosphatase family protein [Tannerellaceae bacterium]